MSFEQARDVRAAVDEIPRGTWRDGVGAVHGLVTQDTQLVEDIHRFTRQPGPFRFGGCADESVPRDDAVRRHHRPDQCLYVFQDELSDPQPPMSPLFQG